jgi:cytoskeleton protein RodZ
MTHDELFINGELLRIGREARGWGLNDMAIRACMSVKQIRQLEEGGTSAFYSTAVKATAAKKLVALLGLSVDEVFAQKQSPVDESRAHEDVQETPAVVSVSEPQLASEAEVAVEQTPANSEAVMSHGSPESAVVATPVVDGASKSKTSLFTIAVLFIVALGAAAYLQPKDEPVAENVPPVQVLPGEAAEPASAASGAEGTASSSEASVRTSSAPLTAAKPLVAASVGVVGAAAVPSASSGVAPLPRPDSASVTAPTASSINK